MHALWEHAVCLLYLPPSKTDGMQKKYSRKCGDCQILRRSAPVVLVSKYAQTRTAMVVQPLLRQIARVCLCLYVHDTDLKNNDG